MMSYLDGFNDHNEYMNDALRQAHLQGRTHKHRKEYHMSEHTVFSVNDQNQVVAKQYQVNAPYYSNYRKNKASQLAALDKAIQQQLGQPVTEISSFSQTPSKQLSAFNLKMALYNDAKGNRLDHPSVHPLENIFQASKHFDKSGCQLQLLNDSYCEKPWLAKKAVKDYQRNEKIDSFQMGVQKFSNEPKSAYYNYLYSQALVQHPKLLDSITKHDQFSDINYTRGRGGINCQAESCAIAKALVQRGQFKHATQNFDTFVQTVYGGDLLKNPAESKADFTKQLKSAEPANKNAKALKELDDDLEF